VVRPSAYLTENEVTPPALFYNRQLYNRQLYSRRRFIVGAATLLGGGLLGSTRSLGEIRTSADCKPFRSTIAKLPEDEKLTPLSAATGYNNYYEFSSDKKAVRILAQALTIEPWTITLEGEVEKPITLDMNEVRNIAPSEERVYWQRQNPPVVQNL
jgi:methionine sulfoxide reductase catalytic subunit